MRVRALTVGLCVLREDFQLGGQLSSKLGDVVRQLDALALLLQREGYEVQTKRVALNSFEDWLGPGCSDADVQHSMALLVSVLREHKIDFCSLGGCSSLWGLRLTPSLLAHSPVFSSSFRIDYSKDQIFPALAVYEAAAETVIALSKRESSGSANFNFCVSFNCPPNIPFFPASYQATGRKPTLTVALENGDLLFLAFHGVTSHQQATSNLAEVMAQALIPIEKIITEGLEAGLEYGGIDASLNPGLAMQDSVVGGLENLFPHRFGAMGTLAAVAVATAAVRSVQSRVKLMGYSGLMLPVMEDAVLAARANADPPSFTVRDLVLFSSSCGVGLDMVPVAGDISVSALAALYLEVSALSNRLQCKPLAARILPIPNKRVGEYTSVENPFLLNCRVLPHE